MAKPEGERPATGDGMRMLREAIDVANGTMAVDSASSASEATDVQADGIVVPPHPPEERSPQKHEATLDKVVNSASVRQAEAAAESAAMLQAARAARSEAELVAAQVEVARDAEAVRADAEATRLADLAAELARASAEHKSRPGKGEASTAAAVTHRNVESIQSSLAAKKASETAASAQLARAKAQASAEQASSAIEAEVARAASDQQAARKHASSSTLQLEIEQGRTGFGLVLDDSLQVVDLQEGGPAEQAGVPLHSRVVEVAGTSVTSKRDLAQAVAQPGNPSPLPFIFLRPRQTRLDLPPTRTTLPSSAEHSSLLTQAAHAARAEASAAAKEVSAAREHESALAEREQSRLHSILSICVGLVCGHIPILPTRVISVLGLKSTLENPQIQVYFAGNGLLAGENGWPFRRFCGGGGGLPAPLLAPRALILRTNQRLDALSRPTPPYFGHA